MESKKVAMENMVIRWPDTGEKESGFILNENDTDVLFQSHDDGTVNWVPKKYVHERF
jgi:hypothetical protein